MKCWRCKEEMTIEFDNPWRLNKVGDKIRTTTYICWGCQTILKIQATEVNLDKYDICDDDGAA